MSDPDDRRDRHADFLAARRIHWPESITPVTQLMTAVFRLGDLTLRASTGRVAALGLTFSEFEVLATLRGHIREEHHDLARKKLAQLRDFAE